MNNCCGQTEQSTDDKNKDTVHLFLKPFIKCFNPYERESGSFFPKVFVIYSLMALTIDTTFVYKLI